MGRAIDVLPRMIDAAPIRVYGVAPPVGKQRREDTRRRAFTRAHTAIHVGSK